MSTMSRSVALMSAGLTLGLVAAGAAIAQKGDGPTAPPAGNAEITSTYTGVGVEDCPQISSDRMGGSWRCEAIAPFDNVIFSEGDLRQFIRFEIDGRALGPIFMVPNFNYTGDTLEWRLADGEPFAVILRYFLDGQYVEGVEDEFQRLYVGRVTPTETCTVGYVTVAGNPDHNADARRMADAHARTWECGTDDMLEW